MANRVWIVLQHKDGQFPRISYEAVAAGQKLAKELGGKAEAVILGTGVGLAAAEVAKLFELDTRRVEVLPSGVLLLEQFSQLLGQPLQIGKGGLREGVVLELLTDPQDETAAA